MLTLSQNTLIGKGLHRECHVHPDYPDRCIKVVVNGDNKETMREQRYYRLLKKRNINWDKLPRFFGNVDTNMGNGAVFELIRDHDGQVGKTLKYYIEDDSQLSTMQSELVTLLLEFRQYLLEQNIITMSIKPQNLLVQHAADGEKKLYLIDSMGNSDLFPISSYSRVFGKRKILRKWQKFKSFLLLKYPNNQIVKNIADSI